MLSSGELLREPPEAELRRSGKVRQPEGLQDLLERDGVCNESDYSHAGLALWAFEGVELVHPAHALGPSAGSFFTRLRGFGFCLSNGRSFATLAARAAGVVPVISNQTFRPPS